MEDFPWKRGYNRDLAENLEGGGIDLIGRWVLFAIELILKSEPDVYLYLPCEAGSRAPIVASTWPTDCTDSSTMRDCTRLPLGARSPFRYCLVKVLRIGTRSRYKTGRGLRSMSQQKPAHFVQCLLAAADQLSESPLEMSFASARKLFA